LPWCAAGAEWTLTLVDPPADLNLYMAADARVLIFRERARDIFNVAPPVKTYSTIKPVPLAKTLLQIK